MTIWLTLWAGLALAQDDPKPAEPADSEAPAEETPEGDAPEGAPLTDEDGMEAPIPDRSRVPDVLPPEALDLDEFEVYELWPGMTVHQVVIPRVRDVRMELTLWRGYSDTFGWPTQEAQFMGWAMDLATEKRDSAELSRLEDVFDMDVSSSISHHMTQLSLEVPLENLEIGLELTSDVLRNPAFPKAEVKRHKRDLELYYLVEAPKSPGTLAWRTLSYAWIGKDHPYGARPVLDDIASVKPAMLPACHERILNEAPATIMVVKELKSCLPSPLPR